MNSCLLRDGPGRTNEEKFANYIDEKDQVKWWFKNGDSGKDSYSIKYYNVTDQKESLFHPDWLIKLKSGDIGIFDTKGGQTLNTEGRAKALGKKIEELGEGYFGGIVRFANGVWEYYDLPDYDDISPDKNDWKPMENIFT